MKKITYLLLFLGIISSTIFIQLSLASEEFKLPNWTLNYDDVIKIRSEKSFGNSGNFPEDGRLAGGGLVHYKISLFAEKADLAYLILPKTLSKVIYEWSSIPKDERKRLDALFKNISESIDSSFKESIYKGYVTEKKEYILFIDDEADKMYLNPYKIKFAFWEIDDTQIQLLVFSGLPSVSLTFLDKNNPENLPYLKIFANFKEKIENREKKISSKQK